MIVFCDTGVEHTYTYELVEKMKKLVKPEFVTVESNLGTLYEYYFKVKKIPSFMKRDCTSKFKIYPMRRYLRKRYGKKEIFGLYLGIAYEEFTRMKKADVKYITNLYPFCEDKITRDGNLEILKRYGIEAKKSGCIGCIYNRKSEWLKLLKEHEDEFMKYELLDKNNSRYPEISLINGSTMERFRKAVEQQLSFDIPEAEPNCAIYGSCFL